MALQSLVGKEVRFSIEKEKLSQGVVMDKILMVGNADSTVTGYVVEEKKTGAIFFVQYWRIKQILS